MEPVMVTAREYAEIHGYNHATVSGWCAHGKLPGAIKVPCSMSPYGYAYLIPENAIPIRRKRGKPRKEPEPEPKRQYTNREAALYIRKHAHEMSYAQLKAELGMSHEEIQRIYDRLHRKYGIRPKNKNPRRQVYDAAVRGDHDRRVMHINYTMEAAEMQINAKKPRHPARIYLSEYCDMKRRIDALREELATIREMATNVSVRADADRVTGSRARDTLANHAVRSVDVQRRLEETFTHLQECLDMRLFLINQMDVEEERLVLTYRYINCLPWEDIQRKMHYGPTATYELHGRALQSFWKVYQMTQKNGV